MRLAKARHSWIELSPGTFCKMTGCSRRTFFYAKRKLETYHSPTLSFKTVLKSTGRGWRILVSAAAGYLFRQEKGHDRRARDRLLTTECSSYIRNTTCSRNITPTLGGFGLSPPSSSQIRLAHWIKRQLEDRHWDNCKVKYSPGMAFLYARDMIALSRECSEIIRFYGHYLEYYHGLATDMGTIWAPSSTVSAARRALRAKGAEERTFSAPPRGNPGPKSREA